MAQICAMLCARLKLRDHPLTKFLDEKKCREVITEADSLLPHFQMLIASEAMKKKKARTRGEQSQASMMANQVVGRDRAEVERAAKFVYTWLKKSDSPLRNFLTAASDGGIFFTANVHAKVAVSYVHHRVVVVEGSDQANPGVSIEHFVTAAQGRLCD